MSKVYLSTEGFKSGMYEYHLASRQISKRHDQAFQAKKRAKRWGVESSLTAKEWLNILIESEGYCFYCKKDVGAHNLGMDHVIPMFLGAANSLENIVASCFPCNAKKGKSLPSQQYVKKIKYCCSFV